MQQVFFEELLYARDFGFYSEWKAGAITEFWGEERHDWLNIFKGHSEKIKNTRAELGDQLGGSALNQVRDDGDSSGERE